MQKQPIETRGNHEKDTMHSDLLRGRSILMFSHNRYASRQA
jgi:hypothetical protein